MTGMASDVSRRWKRRVAKENSRISSTCSIAVTEVSSMSGGSNRSSSLESFDQTVSFCEPIDDVQPEESHIDRLALRVAKLEDEVKSEGRHIRQQRRKLRIHKAREEYLACLEALSTTTSNALEASTSEFYAENGLLVWEECKL